jgi:hypothetical protein
MTAIFVAVRWLATAFEIATSPRIQPCYSASAHKQELSPWTKRVSPQSKIVIPSEARDLLFSSVEVND